MINADDDALPAGESDELDPSIKPKSARAWWAQIENAEKVFREWQDRADNIDKLYANLAHLANVTREREFQLFWANVEVLKPSIYARPPIPVVTTRFKDRRQLYRTASDFLERCCIVSFDLTDIDSVMKLVRDDVAVVGRGVPWVRYETRAESGGATERVCIDHKNRRDFLHDPARNWREVDWVAGASYLTKKEMRKRFAKSSGKAYQSATYLVQKEAKEVGGADNISRAKVWELWCQSQNKVVWITEGVDVFLDEGEPHLKLEKFFPCPEPAYATVQRGSLVPVPDMVFYKDQLEEINELTGRIHALAQAVQVRGFYPAGAGDIGKAIEAAIKTLDNRKIMIPVNNWAALGGAAPKDTIVWLPIDQIVSTIQSLVELRRQVIEDVYQIMGLSDIMRGATDPKETLGAQQLKSQYGSVRVRGKQSELARVARDLVRIVGEVLAEQFSPKTLGAMSQMDLPSDEEVAQQLQGLAQQEEQIALQAKQAIQANPQAQEQIEQQAEGQIAPLQQQIAKLRAAPTMDAVLRFLKDEKTRPFVLDIETDSTIQPDEDAEKQRRAEFMTAIGAILPRLTELVQLEPGAAPFAGELLKFGTGAFRPGRQLEAAIDEFVDTMRDQAQKPRPNPEAEAQKAEAEREDKRLQFDMQKAAMDNQTKQQESMAKVAIEREKAQWEQQQAQIEAASKQQEAQARLEMIDAQMRRDDQKHALEMERLHLGMEAERQKLAMQERSEEVKIAGQMQAAETQARQADQQYEQNERAFEQKSALAEQQAAAKAQQASHPSP